MRTTLLMLILSVSFCLIPTSHAADIAADARSMGPIVGSLSQVELDSVLLCCFIEKERARVPGRCPPQLCASVPRVEMKSIEDAWATIKRADAVVRIDELEASVPPALSVTVNGVPADQVPLLLPAQRAPTSVGKTVFKPSGSTAAGKPASQVTDARNNVKFELTRRGFQPRRGVQSPSLTPMPASTSSARRALVETAAHTGTTDATPTLMINHALRNAPYAMGVWDFPLTYKLSGLSEAKNKVMRFVMASQVKLQFMENTCVWLEEADDKALPFVSMPHETGSSGGAAANALGPLSPRQGEIKVQLFNDFASCGVLLHEYCHVLGMMHTHQRRDRDKYVVVDRDACIKRLTGPASTRPQSQVEKEFVANYKIRPEFKESDSYEFIDSGSYDFESVMHYPFDEQEPVCLRLAKPNTVKPSKDNLSKGKLSQGDIEAINRANGCVQLRVVVQRRPPQPNKRSEQFSCEPQEVQRESGKCPPVLKTVMVRWDFPVQSVDTAKVELQKRMRISSAHGFSLFHIHDPAEGQSETDTPSKEQFSAAIPFTDSKPQSLNTLIKYNHLNRAEGWLLMVEN